MPWHPRISRPGPKNLRIYELQWRPLEGRWRSVRSLQLIEEDTGHHWTGHGAKFGGHDMPCTFGGFWGASQIGSSGKVLGNSWKFQDS
jgi:hypothetical protein